MSEPAQTWITGDGSFEAEHAPEDIRGMIEAKGWKGVPDVLKSYGEIEKYNSKVKAGGLQIPDKLKDEDVAVIYQRLGRPESPDQYSYKPPEKPIVPIDDNLLKSFRAYAHGLNLTDKQFNEVVNFQVDAMAAAMTAQAEQTQAARARAAEELKAEWKENYDLFFKEAKSGSEKLELLDFFDEMGISDDPRVIRKMKEVNAKLSEDFLQPNKEAGGQIDKTSEIEQILKSDAMKNRLHPDHKKVHARYLELCGVKKTG